MTYFSAIPFLELVTEFFVENNNSKTFSTSSMDNAVDYLW